MASSPYFEYFCPVKILSGYKALPNLPFELHLLGARRPLLVTDPGVAGAGLLAKVQAAFEGSPCEMGGVFDRVPPDSSRRIVNEVARLYGEQQCDAFVAIGGGSVLDTVKCANMMVTEGTTDLMRFQGSERLTRAIKPFIAIPTTAGTGSEVTRVAIVLDEESGHKMAFSSCHLFPHVAILDPVMTLSLPPRLTAATGMDALTHAIEALYSLQRNPISDAMAVTAIDLIRVHLMTSVENGGDAAARLGMANAALIAGIAFSNAMVGIVHALAHACGGVARVPHGVANAVLLPWGMESNLELAAEPIAKSAKPLGVEIQGTPLEQARAAVAAVRAMGQRLHTACGLPVTLREAGVQREQLPAIARVALDDGSVTFNPDDMTLESALAVLEKAY